MKRVAAAIFLLLSGCDETSHALPNGYAFIKLSGRTGAITKGGEFVVYPNVTDYEVRGDLVRGRRALATDNTDGSSAFTSNLGNFTLNTQTGVVRYDLLNGQSADDR